jgi:hypothetical protein
LEGKGWKNKNCFFGIDFEKITLVIRAVNIEPERIWQTIKWMLANSIFTFYF